MVLCFVDSSSGEATTSSRAGPSSAEPTNRKKKGGKGKKEEVEEEKVVSDDKAAAWDAGEVGGFEAYLLAEDDKEGVMAEDTYRVVRCPTIRFHPTR